MVAGSTSKSSIRVNPPTKRWGEVAVDKGFITNDQLQEALEEQKRGQQTGNIELLGAVLIRKRMITREQAIAVDRAMQGTSQLSGFEILEKVGQGGMGAVFRARQISMDRIVALKILPRKLAQDPKAKERFFREARLCASMNHLNLINGIDCGEAGGYTFFAMEFVEGETARKVLKTKGRLETKEVVGIIRQIATALDYAHSKKLVHRDVKPENIMITPEGVAKLCDLGLSRSFAASSEEDPSLTQAGQAVGTPYYISPEQARGEDVDGGTDIYSLGATFYHLLAGKPPFEGASAAVIMAKHLTDTAPPLSSHYPDLDDDYAFIVSKMMAKAKDDRYSTLKEVLADLDAVERGETPTASSFRAQSSCPRPAAGGRRTTGPTHPVTTTAERLVRTTRSRSTSSGSNSQAGAGLIVGGGVAALVLIGIAVMGSGGGGGGGGGAAPKPQAVAPKPVQPAPTIQPVQANQPPPNAGRANSHPPHQAAPGQRPPPNNPRPNADPIGMADPVTKNPEESMPNSMLPIEPKPDEAGKVEPPKADPPKTAVVVAEVQPPEKAIEVSRPVLDLKSTVLRARFLAELQRKAAKLDFTRLMKDAKELASKPDYAAIKEALDADIKDIEGLIKYELAMAQAIGEAKPEIDLPRDHMYKKSADKARVKEFSNGKVMCMVGGAEAPLLLSTLPPKLVIDTAKLQGRDAEAANYLLSRGDAEEAARVMGTLPEAERARLKEKMDLIKTGELELAAQAYFDSIVTAANAKQWKVVWDKIPAFNQQHGATHLSADKAVELGEHKARAEDALWPLQAIFKTKAVKALPDGFVEVTYDFTNAEQLKDFECEQADLTIRNGKMRVPQGDDTTHARYLPRIAELRKFEVTCRTHHDERERMGIALVKTKDRIEWTAPMLIFRPKMQRASLENWDGERMGGGPGGRSNAVGRNELDWLQDVSIVVEPDKDSLKWTVDGSELGKVKVPERFINGHLAFFGSGGNNSWSGLKIVFKPDPEWVKEARKAK